jgi:uncharacterized protein
MIGMSASNGKKLEGDEHLAQSIADILTTPMGTRLMRRDYGSLLPELLDRPFNTATRLLCVMATAIALGRWEPRITVRRVEMSGDFAAGAATITVTGVRTDDPDPNALTRLTIPIR